MSGNQYRLNEMQKAAQTLADAMVPLIDRMTRNCTNCYQFDHGPELCRKFATRPPIKVAVKGCPQWEIDIPF
jgi:hypothetical protein